MGNVISCDPLITRAWDALQSFGWEFGVRHAAYVYQLEDNLKALKGAVEDLRALEKKVMRRVILEEQQNMMTIKRLPSVELWFSRVATATGKGDELVKEGQRQVDRLCIGGICSTNYLSTSSFGKKVSDCLSALKLLKEEDLTTVTGETPPEENYGAEKHCDPTVGLEPKLLEVLRYLEEDEAGMVGIYGIGGVGKTTLLKQINNHFVRTTDFLVIWVDVSQDIQLERIQLDIGESVGLPQDWKKKSLEKRAIDMLYVLRRKKFILLLDDLWDRMELETIGVPLSEDLIGSKIIFTTRQKEVCTQMEAQRSISVETLAWEQAWILFQKKVTEDTINRHPEIPPLAQTVARKCDGLPLALCIIGLAMSSMRQPREWVRAIKIFERPTRLPLQDRKGDLGMAKLFSLLRFSYDNLASDKVKSCFLYCALFPEDYQINKKRLVELWICSDFWPHDDGDEYDDEIDEAYFIIGTLVNASLLEDGGDWVKLHDMVRSMALWIGKGDMLVMAGMQLMEAPAVTRWEEMKKVSLMQNNIAELTEEPKCPNLVTLFLNHNQSLHLIKDGFFEFADGLTILDLSHTAIEWLPGSISKLVSLQYLDISHTHIYEMPTVLTKLTKLKFLDISHLPLRMRSQHVIRHLSCLQVFRRLESKHYYSARANKVSSTDGEILLEELQCLKHISALDITLDSASALEKLLDDPKLLTITRGLCFTYFGDTHSMTGLCNSASLRYKSFNNLESLLVVDCREMKDLTCIISMPNLRNLVIKTCENLEEIISGKILGEVLGSGAQNVKPFSHLASLTMFWVPELISIYPGTLPFPFLIECTIEFCPKLKKLPLDAKSGTGAKIQLNAEKEWWDAIEWEDEATKASLLSRLKCNFLHRPDKKLLIMAVTAFMKTKKR